MYSGLARIQPPRGIGPKMWMNCKWIRQSVRERVRESFHVPFSSSLPPSSSLILLFLSVPFATDYGGGCGRDSFTPFLPLPFLSPFLLMGGGGEVRALHAPPRLRHWLWLHFCACCLNARTEHPIHNSRGIAIIFCRRGMNLNFSISVCSTLWFFYRAHFVEIMFSLIMGYERST